MYRLWLAAGIVVAAALGIPSQGLGEEARFGDVGLTISDSPTDPLSNFGPAHTDSMTVYLWLYCAQPGTGGVSRVDVAVYTDAFVLGFEPSPDVVVNEGSFPPEILSLTLPGCPFGSFLIGSWQVLSFTGDSYLVCLFPWSPGVFGVYSCNDPTTAMDFNMLGYSAGSPDLCTFGFDWFDWQVCEPPTSTESSSWGRLKALYYYDFPGK